MKLIPLYDQHGEVIAYAEVDDADHEPLTRWRWHRNAYGYAVRSTTRRGQHLVYFLHRQLLGVEHGARDGTGARIEVDHEDLDKLNCRRSNLRITTSSGNKQNAGLRRDNKSGERGVRWDPHRRRWIAEARVGSRRLRKRCATRREAIALVRAWRREHMPLSAEATVASRG